MQGPSGQRLWIGAAVSLSFGLSLTWGLLQFGSAELSVLYRLFLLLLVPSLVALAASPWRRTVDPRFLAVVLLGLYLLGQVALQPTLEARGYLHLAVGWIALWLSLWLAVRGRSQRRFLMLLLVLLGALEAFYGLIQSIGGYDYIGTYFRHSGRLATGTLINRNHFAALLNMLLPLALGMLFADQALKRSERATRSESLARTWIVLLGCSGMGVAVLLSQSRGGTLVLLLTLLFMAMLLTLSRQRGSRRGLSGSAAGVLLFLIMGMGAAFGFEALLERFGKVEESLSRVEIYQDTLDMIGDSPVIGVGPGMYQWRFRLYQTTQPGAFYDHAHNDYLETAAEWGIPLAMLLWGFVIWRFYRSSVLSLSARDPRNQGLALGTAGALFSILIHSFVGFSLQIPAVLMVFSAIVALSWSLDLAGDGLSPSHGLAPSPVLRVLLGIALLLAGWQTLERTRADQAAQPEYGVPGLERSVELDPRAPEPQYLLGMAYRDLPGVGDLQVAGQRLQQAVRFNPYAWRYWMELSRVQELIGDLDQAEASLLVAVNLNPSSGEYRWRLANLLLRQGNLDEAVEKIAAAVELEPRLTEPALVLLLKSGVEAELLEDLLPDDRMALLRVLRSVLRTNLEVEEGLVPSLVATIWLRLLAASEPLTIDEGRVYVDHLFRSGQYWEARQAWLDLSRLHGVTDAAFEQGSNLIWNGEFELELVGAPLGWWVGRSEGFVGRRASGGGNEDSMALEIEFLGTENLSFADVSQELILEPQVRYRLTTVVRTDELSTDQGIFTEMISRDPDGLLVSTEPVLGTTEWISSESEFTMPAGSGRAVIRLRRRPSQLIDNRLRGKVYVDSVTIEQVNP